MRFECGKFGLEQAHGRSVSLPCRSAFRFSIVPRSLIVIGDRRNRNTEVRPAQDRIRKQRWRCRDKIESIVASLCAHITYIPLVFATPPSGQDRTIQCSLCSQCGILCVCSGTKQKGLLGSLPEARRHRRISMVVLTCSACCCVVSFGGRGAPGCGARGTCTAPPKAGSRSAEKVPVSQVFGFCRKGESGRP